MSKKINLYSEDKKHRCAVELADSCDRFNCPDHSVLVLFEERENGTYVIAQAQDHLLETEKDQQIAELKQQRQNKLEELHIAYCGIEAVKTKNRNLKAELKQLKHQLAELKENYETTEQLRVENLENEVKCGERDVTRILELQEENQVLKQQLAEKDKEIENLRTNKKDAMSWVLSILQEILKEYEEK